MDSLDVNFNTCNNLLFKKEKIMISQFLFNWAKGS